MTTPENKNTKELLMLSVINTAKHEDFLVVNKEYLFSIDNSLCEPELANIKFYYSDDGIINNNNNGKFIGYLVSGDLNSFRNNKDKNKKGGVL